MLEQNSFQVAKILYHYPDKTNTASQCAKSKIKMVMLGKGHNLHQNQVLQRGDKIQTQLAWPAHFGR